MNDKILLSIVIPIYNNSEFLKPLLKSLIKQKKEKKDIEVVAVDDGSTQDMSFLDQCQGIKVIHKENGGCASARNAGLAAARGEYVTFLDADDAIKDNYIEVIYNDCFRNVDYVTYRWEFQSGKRAGKNPDCSWIPNYNVWSYLFKKNITQNKWFDENRNAADDWPWLQQVLKPNFNRYDSNESLVIYNTNNYNSLTKRVERGEIHEFKNRF